jgi:plasmid stabilization system protein ParE
MIYSVELTLKSRSELFEAWAWYEEKQAGLGNQFEKGIFYKIDQIQIDPLHYPLKGRYYQAVVDVFPFVIVYKIRPERNHIIITSIFHTKRHPRKKY